MINQAQRFGYIKAGKRVPMVKIKSKTHGNLLVDNFPVEFNKLFGILQMLKKTKYSHIYPKTRLRVVAVSI